MTACEEKELNRLLFFSNKRRRPCKLVDHDQNCVLIEVTYMTHINRCCLVRVWSYSFVLFSFNMMNAEYFRSVAEIVFLIDQKEFEKCEPVRLFIGLNSFAEGCNLPPRRGFCRFSPSWSKPTTLIYQSSKMDIM